MRTLSTILFTCLLTLLFAGTTYAQWVQTSLDSVGINSLATIGNSLFAGASAQPVFRSTDNGNSWICVSPNPLSCGISYLIGVSGTHVFVGHDSDMMCAPSRVYRSSDNGSSWMGPLQGLRGHPSCFASGPSSIFYGTWGGFSECGVNGYGIFRSTDNGDSWIAVNDGLRDIGFTNISAIAVTATSITASTGDPSFSAGSYRSTNDGASWTGPDTSILARFLAVSGTSLFAGTWTKGVFRSDDDGISWTPVNNGLTDSIASCFAVKGSNVFAGTTHGVFLTTNHGTSWTSVNNGLTDSGIVSLTVNDSFLFAGTASGVWSRPLSEMIHEPPVSNGWVQTSLDSVSVNSFALFGMNLFAGSDSGIFRSTDYGVSWLQVGPAFVDGFTISGTDLFAKGNGVFLSTNGGSDWFTINEGLPKIPWDNSKYEYVWSIVASGLYLYAATWDSGVFVSTNSGVNWHQVESGFPLDVRSFAKSESNLFAGAGDGVYLSTNSGTNWTKTSLVSSWIPPHWEFGVDGRNVVVEEYLPDIFEGGLFGLYVTTDSGTSWTDVTSALIQHPPVYSIAVKGANIFLGTHGGGVTISTDNGGNWTQVNGGLIDSVITSLIISDSFLFAGTASGVWKRPLSEMITDVSPAAKELPRTFLLNQNYPNPFNNGTIISYQLPTQSHVTLKVFDVLGREVATLINKVEEVGYKSVSFDASKLPSGVYFYRIQVGSFVQTNKMLLLK
jgi:photosystem II stability/assembly factor-like uncharacterized protein